jgi:2-oxoglutarate dehydrogenase E2 component (dihydrolipoamide succinyltransferase)
VKEGDTVEVGSDLFKVDTDAQSQDKKVDSPPQPTLTDAKPKEKVAVKTDEIRGEPTVPKTIKETAAAAVKNDQPKPAPKPATQTTNTRPETREKLTRMRLRIAERMKEAQNTAASLTTFNEVDMSEIIAIRNKHKDAFLKEHGVKLGYMSMFMRACAIALQEIPIVNSRLDPDTSELVLPEYVDISVAVATPKVPA